MCFHIMTNTCWYICNRQFYEDMGILDFSGHIRALAVLIRVADQGNLLVWQLGRHLCLPKAVWSHPCRPVTATPNKEEMVSVRVNTITTLLFNILCEQMQKYFDQNFSFKPMQNLCIGDILLNHCEKLFVKSHTLLKFTSENNVLNNSCATYKAL